MKQRMIADTSKSHDDEGLLVSRLVDDDLNSEELAVLLKRMSDNDDLRQQWGSYNLLGAALQGHHQPDTDYRGFASRIAAAIDDEPTVLAPRRRWLPGHTGMKRVAGVAIAAGVTALTIGGVQEWDRLDSSSATMVVASQVDNNSRARPVPNQRAVVVYYSSPSHPVDAQPQHNYPDAVNQHALGAYLVNHNEYSPSAGMHGVLPYARIVSHESR